MSVLQQAGKKAVASGKGMMMSWMETESLHGARDSWETAFFLTSLVAMQTVKYD